MESQRSGNQGKDMKRKICLGNVGKSGFLKTLPTTFSSLLSFILTVNLTLLQLRFYLILQLL